MEGANIVGAIDCLPKKGLKVTKRGKKQGKGVKRKSKGERIKKHFQSDKRSRFKTSILTGGPRVNTFILTIYAKSDKNRF